MKKVSIIVPAYNCEKYIKRCLNSLVNQTYPNLEILVCNDGSKDNTLDILYEYAKRFNNIKIIDKPNGGVSSARNACLKIASGDYIGFCDSDDFVEIDMYEKLVKAIESNNYDLCAVNTDCIYPDKHVIIDSGIRNNQDNHKLLIDAYTVLWNKLYKKELLEGIFMKEGYIYEDVLFLYQIYPRVKRMGSIDETLYHYPQNDNSITYTYSDKLYNLVENMDDIIKYYRKYDLYEDYKSELEYTYVRYLFATFIKRMAKTNDWEKYNDAVALAMDKVKNVFPEYKKNKYIRMNNPKALYLRNFNKLIAKVIYHKEKNKMN